MTGASPHTSYAVAIGSNRRHHRHGLPAGVVRAAAQALAALGTIRAVAPVRATPALGPAGRGFANGAVLIDSPLAPPALLAALKRIERGFGRRGGRRWGPRVLDLDIILWSGGGWAEPGLVIPHPDYRIRDFVLGPLAAIAPGWRDPLSGLTVRQLRHRQRRPQPCPAVPPVDRGRSSF
ncbi:2-amino-4-hydroxy-6-hydroxymethyldihydropteridine diphosphokinase [Sphingomonas changnyeongensis]|uniref:2-amino-4-hydroxy-6-hydroxymethyldihydropteridine pyrophosphokinase n=1 Tax=Sphingomonas changnyeongensis TaxID=2698679 RepID=A0A7Z2NWN3_9SPHN|nr:2-amino-4-hydroxy-6-hydroxymethyldihydropteridine diphosphokinase [Sphingomonas changnyeongensis]QHL90887.1 2-amino-4-hydroxy-6-hydroxymethyldihydropteridine diphosphokinase [Sphingomonas changnyeongensis]